MMKFSRPTRRMQRPIVWSCALALLHIVADLSTRSLLRRSQLELAHHVTIKFHDVMGRSRARNLWRASGLLLWDVTVSSITPKSVLLGVFPKQEISS